MASIDILTSPRLYIPKPHSHFKSLANSKHLNLIRRIQKQPPFPRRSLTVLCSQSGDSSKASKDDFVTRVLKENPSQIEPRYLIGEKFYTLKEKESLTKKPNVGFAEFLSKKLSLKKAEMKKEKGAAQSDTEGVFLSDILREYKGKLYVPEQIFGTELPEEDVFEKSLEELPKMSFEDFQKAMRNDKVDLLTFKEVKGGGDAYGFSDFIVDLKEIPGEKSLHRTKWAMRLDEGEVQALLEEYSGPRYVIERHTTVINSF